MRNEFYGPIHSPPRVSEAPEGVPHRFIVSLTGYYRWDNPLYGERWSYTVYDQEYEGGSVYCYARENYLSAEAALQAAHHYCGEGNGLVRYRYSVGGSLRDARREAGLPVV